MRRLTFALPILFLLFASAPAAGSGSELQIVESVPVETDWDTIAPNTGETWVALFERARTSIDLAQFYLADKPGQALEPVVAALVRAADRGVKVRIMVEKAMAEESADTLAKLGSHENIDWAWFDISERTDGIIHAKYMVIDSRVAFMGSQNFDWRALEHIHEIGLLIADPSAAMAFQVLFDRDWEAMRHHIWGYDRASADRDVDGLPDILDPAPDTELCAPRTTPVVCPVFGPPELLPPGLKPSLEALLEILAGAQESIAIQVMTYDLRDGEEGSWTVIDEALRDAAARGVKVRINIADWSLKSPRIDYLKALQQVANISVRINSIPDWSGGYIPFARVDHSKYMIVDGTIGWVGTSNWGKGYFDSVRAVEVYFNDPGAVKQLSTIFEKGWNGPYAVDLDVSREYTPRKHD